VMHNEGLSAFFIALGVVEFIVILVIAFVEFRAVVVFPQATDDIIERLKTFQLSKIIYVAWMCLVSREIVPMDGTSDPVLTRRSP